MKHTLQLLILFVGLLVLPVSVSLAQQSQPETKAVQRVIGNLFDGLSTLDTAKVRQACNANVKILETGKIWTVDSLTTRVLARKALGGNFKRINEFEFLETKVSGNVAWVSYFNQTIITFNEQTRIVNWLESAVLEKKRGQWKIALLHSTEMK